MSELKEVITSYHDLSFSDRIAFYTTVSNDITPSDDLQSFLIENRFGGSDHCIYCEGGHVVKNGKRKDGTQRYLCRDCHRSFISSSDSVFSRTRKSLVVWAAYLKCMMDQKTLADTSEECHISMSTAFTWRHKILDTLDKLTKKTYLTGTVEADETFFNVSYKGNHDRSRNFSMPRKAHKRGNDNHVKGLSSEKVCVPCAISDTGVSYSEPGKLGKVSTACIENILGNRIAPSCILCTDHEKAYIEFATSKGAELIQTDTDHRTISKRGCVYGIQRINAYHSRLKTFIQRFHGVSTKHLGNYLSWHVLLDSSHRNRNEFFTQLWGQLLCAQITIYGHDIPNRPFLPDTACAV